MRTLTAGRAKPETIEGQVLEIVERLVAELGAAPSRGAARLDDSLDRDLGIGSLERVELIVRLEQSFGVRLPDAVMAGAESPRDLARALFAAKPAVPEAMPEAGAPLGAGAEAPASARTLVEALRWHAEADPDRVHVILREEDGREQPISYGALWDRAAGVAAGLSERGLHPGESVAIMLRTEEAFFHAFFGALLAGGVPVPIYPPFRLDRLEEYAERQVRILQNAEARWLLTFGQAERLGRILKGSVPSLREVITPERLAIPGGRAPSLTISSLDPALIQYTSGSTGDPKGVLLSHANILANIRAIGLAIEIRPDDVVVSWLPLYHDMGLIGTWLASLYFGIPIVILSPLAFLARPARWLWALHLHRGTLSAAPNFAYDLCVKSVGDDEIKGLNLSTWRLAFSGSEPVSRETIERFTRRFAAYGFRPEAMNPAYGLAECAVALTLSPVGRLPRVDRVSREPFEISGRARPASSDDPNPLSFISCGRPIPGHELRVIDEAGLPVEERTQGRIEFSGPSVTSGYWRNPEATRAVLRDGWMDSGDLGYWAEGEIFVTGRRKDLIIKGGRNLHPHEVEEIAGGVPGILKDCVAAFGLHDPSIGTERLVVVAESGEAEPESRERLRAAVVDRVARALGLPPDIVVISDPGSVLKTQSGKIRRGAMRQAYLSGDLVRKPRSVRAQKARLLVGSLVARLRSCRERATALAYAGYVGGVLLVALPALWALLLVVPRGRPADRLVRRWARGLMNLCGLPIRVEGLENLIGAGPAVLAANHASYVDSVALLAAIPPEWRFVAKRELLSSPLIGTVIRRAGHLAVERADLTRSVADAERASALLQAGRSLLFFPEGTFLRPPRLLPFRLGAFKTAVEAQCPIIPIAIRGTREILPAYSWLPRRGAVSVIIGAPIKPEGSDWQEMVRLRDQVRSEIARLSGERGSR